MYCAKGKELTSQSPYIYQFIHVRANINQVTNMNDMRIFKSEGWYVAEIPSLHVVTRAKTINSLRKNLKEAIEVAVEGLIALKSANLKDKKTVLARA